MLDPATLTDFAVHATFIDQYLCRGLHSWSNKLRSLKLKLQSFDAYRLETLATQGLMNSFNKTYYIESCANMLDSVYGQNYVRDRDDEEAC